MKALHMIAFILLVIGGILWAVYGLFDWKIDILVGSTVATVIYVLVGLSAIFEVATHKGRCKECDKGKISSGMGMGMPGGGMK